MAEVEGSFEHPTHLNGSNASLITVGPRAPRPNLALTERAMKNLWRGVIKTGAELPSSGETLIAAVRTRVGGSFRGGSLTSQK